MDYYGTNDISYWPVLYSVPKEFLCRQAYKVYIFHYGKSCLLLTNDNRLYACGNNHYGRLGLGFSSNEVMPPKEIKKLCGKQIRQIIEGSNIIMCLTNNGELYSWGFNHNERLGLTSLLPNINQKSPKRVNIENVVKVVCGMDHSLVLDSDSIIWSWGGNQYGQLGNGNFCTSGTPTRINSLNNVRDIAATFDTSMALIDQRKIYVWGKLSGSFQDEPKILNLNHLVNQNRHIKFKSITAAGYKDFLLLDHNGLVYHFDSSSRSQLIQPVCLDKAIIISAIYSDCKNICAFLLAQDGYFHVWNIRNHQRINESMDLSPSIHKTSITSLADVQYLYCRPVMISLSFLNFFNHENIIRTSPSFSLNDPKKSDLKFKFYLSKKISKTIFVHRCILKKSKYFKHLLKTEWCQIENNDEIIFDDNDNDDNFRTYFSYLRYFYTKQLKEDDESILPQLYRLACKNNEKSLKQKCMEKGSIQNMIYDEIDSSIHDPSTQLFCINIENFFEIYQSAFTINDSELLRKVIDFVCINRSEVFKSPTFFQYNNLEIKNSLIFDLLINDMLDER